MGFGISMPYAYLSEKELYEALKKVLQDPKYLENAQKYGSMLSDQITKPLDRVNYFKTMYVLVFCFEICSDLLSSDCETKLRLLEQFIGQCKIKTIFETESFF